jgi:hypothetical protein
VTTDKVVLRGLTVKGGAGTVSGIHVTAQLSSLYIENCLVTDFAGLTPEAGISINAAGEYFIKDTLVRNNAGRGLSFDTGAGTLEGTVEHCRIENNGGTGLIVQNNATVIARDSVAAGNRGSGFFAGGMRADMSIENCLSSQNVSGVSATAGATVRLSNSTLVKNGGYGLFNFNGTLISYGNNRLGGNNGGGAQISCPITTVAQQ